jgi:hypothetical protein
MYRPPDRRGKAHQLAQVLAQSDVATDVDERIWCDFLVDDHRRARISAQVPALDRVAPRRKYQVLAVEHEPH